MKHLILLLSFSFIFGSSRGQDLYAAIQKSSDSLVRELDKLHLLLFGENRPFREKVDTIYGYHHIFELYQKSKKGDTLEYSNLLNNHILRYIKNGNYFQADFQSSDEGFLYQNYRGAPKVSNYGVEDGFYYSPGTDDIKYILDGLQSNINDWSYYLGLEKSDTQILRIRGTWGRDGETSLKFDSLKNLINSPKPPLLHLIVESGNTVYFDGEKPLTYEHSYIQFPKTDIKLPVGVSKVTMTFSYSTNSVRKEIYIENKFSTVKFSLDVLK